MSGRRFGSDKEVSAVTFNMKEQRYLEKALQTLSLEKTYSIKLLDLDHRVIRVNYRRLKDKVAKIKSNLTAEEIAKLRKLESEGKLKPTYNSVNLTGALKIAAAARRLKVAPSATQRAVSAHPRLADPRGDALTEQPVLSGMYRRNSITGAFIDAPGTEQTRRLSVSDKPRPHSAFTVGQTKFEVSKEPELETRPATTSCLRFDKNKLSVSTPTPGGQGHVHSPFSSHSLAGKEMRMSSAHSLNGRWSRDSKSFYPSDDSIDSNFGEDLHEERRLELLEEELAKSEELELRKQAFLRTIDDYLQKATPLVQEVEVSHKRESHRSGSIAESIGSSRKERRLHRRRQTRVEFDHTPTYLPEAEYRRRLFDLWKDMNKCRYLRVPQEIIDLSGIATLAKDQMRLFEVLRQRDPNSLLASAEL